MTAPDTRYAHLARNCDALIAALKQLGVTRLAINYNGSGDDGSVDDCSTVPPDIDLAGSMPYEQERSRYDGTRWVSQIEPIQMPIEDAAKDFCGEVVYRHFPGWENNDGAEGEVVLEQGQDGDWTARLEHRTFHTEADFNEVTL